MLIAPTEPKELRALGKTSLVTEKLGVDILIPHKEWGTVGIQRKEVNDLIASVGDDRLLKELSQMRQLGLGIVLIEGRLRWTADGFLLTNGPSQWTKAQLRGVIWSINSRGYWTIFSDGLWDTIELLSQLTKWLAKSRHNSLTSRRAVSSIWGKANDRDWGVYVLQSFVGIGVDTAGKIYDHFGGLPIQWTITEQELQQVKGVGKGRARQLIEALNPSNAPNPSPNTDPPRASVSPLHPSVSSSRTAPRKRSASRSSPSTIDVSQTIDLTGREDT